LNVPGRAIGSRLACSTFVVLFLMNMLDYVDRWALPGVFEELKKDLRLSDTELGSLNLFFLISYCIFGVVMGWAGDRYKRTRVGLWSVATVGTGLARNPFELRLARSLLGVGEATYGILAPSLLMDLFSRERRSRVLSAFYIAMPLGYAVGVKLGGYIAHTFHNWRIAFFIVGAPGFAAAVCAYFLPEPVRGQSELGSAGSPAPVSKPPTRHDYRDLLVNSSYTYTVFGMAAYTFAFGGLAYWLPSYLKRVRQLPANDADTMVALTGFFAAIIGMYGGGWLADRLAKKLPSALFLVSGISMIAAAPCVILGLLGPKPMIMFWMFIAQVLMFANVGPSNAIIANVVMPNLRASAYAIMNFFIHFLGDVWSPLLMGYVSDEFGKPSLMATPMGDMLRRLGMVPVRVQDVSNVPTNLGAGMLVVIPALLLGGLVLLAGVRHLPREMALMEARWRALVAVDRLATDTE
jgi:MFS family permease